MEGKVRNLYPGGNTPHGFYSYYNYILPQRKAEKIFCIKGGPGTGKSTLMKRIGRYFVDRGEDVDFLWCSSDPDSLDGILIRGRRAAVLDGTAPHIVDPVTPGAVDEIINLGQFWDEEKLKGSRWEIMRLGEEISDIFGYAYGYLKSAGQQYEFLGELLERNVTDEKLWEYRSQLKMKLDAISILRRAESKMRRDYVMGGDVRFGERRKFFAGAITPGGIKSNVTSVIEGVGRVVVLDVPVGSRTEVLLGPVSRRLTEAGFDVEEYYCPMSPERKLEHVVCEGADLAVICSNEYHVVDSANIDGKVVRIKADEVFTGDGDRRAGEVFEDVKESSRGLILKAVALLEKAKGRHDMLEKYYVDAVDFDALRQVEDHITRSIMK